MPLKHNFRRIWAKLSGHPSEFPLNARIFHSVLMISIIALSYNVPFNFIIGLPKIAILSLVVLVLACSLYYASRFKRKLSQGILISNFIGLGLFIINYFFNSGVDGPTDVFFLLMLLLGIGINPVEQYKIWIPVNISTVLTLHAIEYFYPEIVPNSYDNRFSHFVDVTSAYVVVALVAYIGIDYIRRGYERERNSAREKSAFILKMNAQITIQNQELEKLNLEKNKLMSIVAHDFRSPLASILNYLEFLNDNVLDEQSKLEIEKDLLNSTKDTMEMLAKLLDWSKSQIHGVSAHPENLNLYELLQSTINSEKMIGAQKSIIIDSNIDVSLNIYADKNMMLLIIRNIIGNAIKFTSAGGKIAIHAESNNSECLISIKDSGIGISVERHNALFSLNAQSTYGTKGEKGAGLGLLLCREYITAQNGKIWLESIPDNGTYFYITIPLSKNELLLPA